MNLTLRLYQDPSATPYDITQYVPQDSLSLLQANLDDNTGILRANLTLELYRDALLLDKNFRVNIRKPGILIISSGSDFLFALYYNPVNTEYDPTTQRYRLNFVGLLEAVKSYVSKDYWWNVLDAASFLATFKEFLAQYLPTSLVNFTAYLPSGMSPIQNDPSGNEWDYFAGFIQPSSWLVGREIGDEINLLFPWKIINVLGVAKSLAQTDTIFALCLAKPNGWWDFAGDYVWPVVVKAKWNSLTWDWDIEAAYWHEENDDMEDPLTWSYPVWFGLKHCPAVNMGDVALIYSVSASEGERVVCAWLESSIRDPQYEGEDYVRVDDCQLRCVLMDGDLTLLDQEKIAVRTLDVGDGYTARIAPQAVMLRGVGFQSQSTLSPCGAVLVGINGIVPYNCDGEGRPGYGASGQDGIATVRYVRWDNNIWLDNELENLWQRYFIMSDLNDTDQPQRLLDFEPFSTGLTSPGNYYVHIIVGRRDTDTGNLALNRIVYLIYSFNAESGVVDFELGDWWTLQYEDYDTDKVKVMPHFAVPCSVGNDSEIGFILGYGILTYGESGVETEDVCFVDVVSGELRHDYYYQELTPWNDPYTKQLNKEDAGVMELDIKMTEGSEYRRDPRQAPVNMWDDDESEQNLASQLRTMLACRMRPCAIQYYLNPLNGIVKVKFLISHHTFTSWECFAIAGSYEPGSGISIYTMDGRNLSGELVPKIGGWSYNESDVWVAVSVYHTILGSEYDPRFSGYDAQGDFGKWVKPIGTATIPVVKKVCENELVYSDPGRLEYSNMANSTYRYDWNVYNAHRLFVVSVLSYWSFVDDEIDYREKTNLDLLAQSWDSSVHGLSYVVAKINIGGTSANRICPVLVPRWPLRGDTNTISGGVYWENAKSTLYDTIGDIKEKGFQIGFLGRYWDALFLGPEGGALLTNIWWGDEGQFDRELVVKLTDLYPQWFGIAYYRGGLYTDLFAFLRDYEIYLGGENARVGMRELVLPIYSWINAIMVGSLINEDIMDDLEARGNIELQQYVYQDNYSEPVPLTLYWQIVGLRWDLTRNTAIFRLLETASYNWEAPEA